MSPTSLKRQEEVLPMAKLEQRRYNTVLCKGVRYGRFVYRPAGLSYCLLCSMG